MWTKLSKEEIYDADKKKHTHKNILCVQECF